MSTPPKRVNAGQREVTEYRVLNANDRDVEREQLNRILAKLASERGLDDSAAIAALQALLQSQINNLQQQINNISNQEGESALVLIPFFWDESETVVTGTDFKPTHLPCAVELMYARAGLVVPSDTGEVEFDILLDGVSIFGTNKLTVDEGDDSSYNASTAPDYATTILDDDGVITIDVLAAGVNAAGAKIWLVGRYLVQDLMLSYDFSGGGSVGSPVSFSPMVTGGVTPFGSYEITSGALPDGLSIDEDSGVISGSPTEDGTFTFTVSVTDAEGTVATYAGELEIEAATLTYATWNPADKDADITLSGGDLAYTTLVDNFGSVRATQGKSSGKWYWETIDQGPASYAYSGIAQAAATLTDNWVGSETSSISAPFPLANGNEGNCYRNAVVLVNYPSTVGAPTVVRHKLDMDTGSYEVARGAGSFVTVVASGLAGTWYPAATGRLSTGNGAVTGTANFGATAFTYSVPSGYNAGVYTV